MKNYMVPDDPEFQDRKGDPFSYGYKKAGKQGKKYLNQRQKDYQKYGIGVTNVGSASNYHAQADIKQSFQEILNDIKSERKRMIKVAAKNSDELSKIENILKREGFKRVEPSAINVARRKTLVKGYTPSYSVKIAKDINLITIAKTYTFANRKKIRSKGNTKKNG